LARPLASFSILVSKFSDIFFLILRTSLGTANNAQQPAINPGAFARAHRPSACASSAGGQQNTDEKEASGASTKNEQNCSAKENLSCLCWRRVRQIFLSPKYKMLYLGLKILRKTLVMQLENTMQLNILFSGAGRNPFQLCLLRYL